MVKVHDFIQENFKFQDLIIKKQNNFTSQLTSVSDIT